MIAVQAWARVALLACLLLLAGACSRVASAEADAAAYGIESVSASLSTLEAGRHPDVVTEVKFKPSGTPVATTESLIVDLPPGLVANPENFPSCGIVAFNNSFTTPCPQDAQIGVVEVQFAGNPTILREPLYILDSRDDEIVRLGFFGLLFPYYLEIDLRSESDYGVTVASFDIPTEGPPQTPTLIRAKTWGVPASPVHDTERLTPLEAFACPDGTPCFVGGSRSTTLPLVPFMTNPASCGPMSFGFRTTAYQQPGQIFTASASAGEITDCDKVPFDPTLSLAATSREAGAPTGLEATLRLPNNEAVNTANTSPLRSARVTLPEGMTVNAAAANGAAGCDAAQAAYKQRGPAHCPDSSKIGTATIVSANLKRPIQGGIYLRTPEPGRLVRFWLISNELGTNLKIPAEVELDQSTGRLTTVISESPQLPAEEVVLRLNGGPRAALRNPMSCGTSRATYELGPWSGRPPVTGTVAMTVDQGCDTGGFDPKLSAGTVDPSAGRFSPFVFDVKREDGEQNLAELDVALPEGLTAKLAGVELCPEALAPSSNCPAASRVGVVRAAVGAGTLPLWVPQPGKSPTAAYLAGPYKGAPYSLIAKVPAQAGPFDLGVVSVRSAIQIDPQSARVTVLSDPLPQILQGIPIDYRRVRVEADRDDFMLNPTSCAEKRVQANVRSSAGAIARPSDRFQATDCASLAFAPRLNLRLKGGTVRGAHPRLRAALRSRRGHANLRAVSVALPRSEFLEQAHIKTICTRVQFAARSCPKGSIYGKATAITPLLERPLRGPVYLRSSNHDLPDLVVALRGPNDLRVEVAGRIDSVREGIRASFESIPDVPVSKVVVEMKGGERGLLVNSTDICARPYRALVAFAGQNGKVRDARPVLRSDRCRETRARR